MTGELVLLDAVPALINRERAAIAEITEPLAMADAERRAAAIADLTKRAGLAVPIQNEATFLRAECLERLAEIVDQAQQRGEINSRGANQHVRDSDKLPVPRQRLAEGRSLARTGAIHKARVEAEKKPDKPVSMDAILKQAKRSEREGKLREQRQAATKEAQKTERHHAIITADVHDWRPVGVNAIVTDPPYITTDAVELYAALADFAIAVLPDHGALAAMCWQPILPQVMAAMTRPELTFRWLIAWQFDDGYNARTFDMKRRVHDGWKPVLVYHKNGWTEDTPSIYDTIRSPGRILDDHVWQQSHEGVAKLVDYLSRPGELVCDPFCGSGTTAIAALGSDRDFIGADINAAHVEAAIERLAA